MRVEFVYLDVIIALANRRLLPIIYPWYFYGPIGDVRLF